MFNCWKSPPLPVSLTLFQNSTFDSWSKGKPWTHATCDLLLVPSLDPGCMDKRETRNGVPYHDKILTHAHKPQLNLLHQGKVTQFSAWTSEPFAEFTKWTLCWTWQRHTETEQAPAFRLCSRPCAEQCADSPTQLPRIAIFSRARLHISENDSNISKWFWRCLKMLEALWSKS